MSRIDQLKTLRKNIDFATHDTKTKIYAYIITCETAHYTITNNKILINLSKLQDSTIAGIINIVETAKLKY